MQEKTVAARLLLATSSCALATGALANETTTYTYDTFGRLIATSTSGSVNNGVSTSIAYDPAGNRSTYTVTGAGGGGPPPPPAPPPPPPPPPPGNNPPVANPDYLSVNEWDPGILDVVANDTDPDGDYPLTLISVSDLTGTAYVASSTQVGWYGNAAGTYTVQYTVQDARGATSTGTLTVTVQWVNPCGNQVCP